MTPDLNQFKDQKDKQKGKKRLETLDSGTTVVSENKPSKSGIKVEEKKTRHIAR